MPIHRSRHGHGALAAAIGSVLRSGEEFKALRQLQIASHTAMGEFPPFAEMMSRNRFRCPLLYCEGSLGSGRGSRCLGNHTIGRRSPSSGTRADLHEERRGKVYAGGSAGVNGPVRSMGSMF